MDALGVGMTKDAVKMKKGISIIGDLMAAIIAVVLTLALFSNGVVS